jgi:hypothetical protein
LTVQPLTTPGQRGKGRDQSAGLRRALTPASCPAGRCGPTLRFDAQLLVQKLRPRIRAVAAALVQHRCLSASAVAAYAQSSYPALYNNRMNADIFGTAISGC